ncbi:TetR/AcrR family transcriptional regulator [Leucobacter aridicollis]|uniref:TetR/AcrR family transcriptional regulator n=1 Tax=Leucobacter aridicollis TaxID=283878 RepID=UPI000E64DE7C|nr:TetR/AcrR family transcriptional regulator [Leucobacter aridicollis]UTX52674.1 TetR family transcriptional regulator [Leucobacter aridicollis]
MTGSHFPQAIVFDACCTAALSCFEQNGFHGTSIRQIASAAGLSVPGLYHHYPSKAALLEKLCEVSMGELHTALVQARDSAKSTIDRFNRLVACLLEFHAEFGAVAFVTYSEIRALEPGPRAQHIESRRRVEQYITDVVTAGVSEGIFETSEPRHVARAITHICLGVAQWYRPGGPSSVEEIIEIYTGICQDAARHVR